MNRACMLPLLIVLVACSPQKPLKVSKIEPATQRFNSIINDVIYDKENVIRGVDNSEIYIESPSISTAAKFDLDILPALLERMKSNDLTFDQFTRLWAVTNKVLKKYTDGRGAYWNNGGEYGKDAKGNDIFIKPWATDDSEIQDFRDEVVAQVNLQYRQALKSKQNAATTR